MSERANVEADKRQIRQKLKNGIFSYADFVRPFVMQSNSMTHQ